MLLFYPVGAWHCKAIEESYKILSCYKIQRLYFWPSFVNLTYFVLTLITTLIFHPNHFSTLWYLYQKVGSSKTGTKSVSP